MKPTRAELHRLLQVDTRIHVAIAELAVGSRVDRRALESVGIDLAARVATLETDLAKLRAHIASMFRETYPQQPEAGK